MKHSTECISDSIWYCFIYIYIKKMIIDLFLGVRNIVAYLSDILLCQTKWTKGFYQMKLPGNFHFHILRVNLKDISHDIKWNLICHNKFLD